MSTSLGMRAMIMATALCVAPAIASAQAPQTKRCGDGSTSTRSYFACWGHGGVDTSHAVERPRAEAPKHQTSEVTQAGEPRGKHAKSTARAKSAAHPKSTAHAKPKASAKGAKAEHHPAPTAKKNQEAERRGWLPWRHKKGKEQNAKKQNAKKQNAKEQSAKKPKKHEQSSRLPVPERPNGKPR